MEEEKFIVFCERVRKTKWYVLTCPYNVQFVDKIKSIDKEEREWKGKEKKWYITAFSLFKLILFYKQSEVIFFDFGGDENRRIFTSLVKYEQNKKKEEKTQRELLEKKKIKWLEKKSKLENNYEQYSQYLHSLLKGDVSLYPHQIVVALYLNEIRNGLVSHEMGLGKTLSSILFVEMNNFDKVFVLTPNSLKFNYYSEVLKFTNSKPHILNWKKNKYSLEESKYLILNYDFFRTKDKQAMRKKWEKLGVGKIDALICDEAQKLKNSKSNIYKNFRKIFNDKIFKNKSPNKIFMSGTPAPNRAHELYNVLNQISPLEFARKEDFYEFYCGMIYDYGRGWGYEIDTQKQKFNKLYETISPYVHRKRKDDVLKDLPEKTYQKVYLELNRKQQIDYYQIERETSTLFGNIPSKNSNHLSILNNLRQYLSHIKKDAIIDLITPLIEQNEKVVVVDFYLKTLFDLKEFWGDKAVIHTGKQSFEERNEAVEKFQDPTSNVNVLLGGLDVTKEGLTLTASNKMIILTLPFVPGDYDQVASRLHRIGQKRAVNIYIPLFMGTIDEKVIDLLDDKNAELSVVNDNVKYESKFKEDVLSSVMSYLQKNYS